MPGTQKRKLVVFQSGIPNIGYLGAFERPVGKRNMWDQDRKRIRICYCPFDRINIGEEVIKCGNMPNSVAIILVDPYQPDQSESCLQLKKQKIAGLKSVLHLCEHNISI